MKPLLLGALIGWAAFAQSASVMIGGPGAAFATQFRFAATNAADRGFVPGWTIASKAGESVAHRFFFNANDKTYAGYDMTLTPGPDADSYRVSFRDLSVGPLTFVNAAVVGDPTQWTKLTPPSLPHDQVLHTGQPVDIAVIADQNPARTLTDQVTIEATRPGAGLPMVDLQRIVAQMQAGISATAPMHYGPPPEVTGPARDFSLSDVELNLSIPQARINGAPILGPGRVGSARGSLVWVYVPGHGRFVLSAMPRPELRFVKMGELRGAIASFVDGRDKIEVESGAAIAPGEAAYFLYLLHDAEWEPIGSAKSTTVMCGSVSVEEIRALQKK